MNSPWPPLAFSEAKDTYETLHLWTQIAGKIRLSKMHWINHSWHVALYVTPTGLSTGAIPDQEKYFQLDFDFTKHQLQVSTSTGEAHSISLQELSVASCYEKTLQALRAFDIQVNIHEVPNELENPIPFPKDFQHATYHPAHAAALHQVLMQSHKVLTEFRAAFQGKCSPVHFFWGSFDLAVSRFSGRDAPKHPGGVPNLPDWVAQDAYSKEVCSCGFWPGNEAFPKAAYYSYIYPEPEGYKEADITPKQAYYEAQLREYILPYEAVQQADDPAGMLMDFLQSTYEAAANLAKWDREALETINFSKGSKGVRNAYKQTKGE
ncbi:DUF5996 family protein [Pontibacter roseus]|uniref:DUF5996 family protein n=1 Tax=Pontibacter roseus TaxID=336989 RepID=UPI00036B59B7|nr:DUF5996 family protein [Pontibacter roseus]